MSDRSDTNRHRQRLLFVHNYFTRLASSSSPLHVSRAVGRVSDLGSRGRGFESWPACGVKTLCKFLTPVCLSSPSSISWYRHKAGDALRLGSKGRYGSCVVKLCDPLVTHGPYLSALKIGHNTALYKFILLLYFTYIN